MNNKELLKATFLFTNIDDNTLSELASQIEEVKVPAETVFLKEGDKADALYVIKDGILQVFTIGHNNEDIVLARLETGAFFGEQALLNATPGFRNASVRTLNDAILLKIDHKLFLKIIESNDVLRGELKKIGFQQVLAKLQATESEYNISRYINYKDTVYNTKEYNPGDTIITQGDIPDGAYFLVSGIVDVYKKNEQGNDVLFSTRVPNQPFGESSILLHRTREATVKARTPVKTLFIPVDKFNELYTNIPQLKVIADTLLNVYQSPKRGEVTQYIGIFLHMPAVTSIFRLKDGREIVSSNVIGKNIQSIRDSKAKDPKTHSFEKKTFYRELQTVDNLLVGVVSYGEWDSLQELYSRVLDKGTITVEELELFKRQGDITVAKKVSSESDDEVICNCMYVSRGTIKECINEGGCTSVNDVADKTGASSICGSCIPTIQSMLGHNAWQAMHIIRINQLTPDVRVYRLHPIQKKTLKRFLPGQHVVIQCEINGKWVERSYTLTSAPGNSDYYEIAIKQEPSGLFSKWLFENENKIPFVRASHPSGELVFDTKNSARMICFTAGIGVTPTVGFARAILEEKAARPLYIFSTARNQERLVYDAELEDLSKKTPHIEYVKHLTEEKGRIKAEDVIRIAQQDLNADFYICGPKEFETMVKTALMSAGISEKRIFIEEFTNATAPAN